MVAYKSKQNYQGMGAGGDGELQVPPLQGEIKIKIEMKMKIQIEIKMAIKIEIKMTIKIIF